MMVVLIKKIVLNSFKTCQQQDLNLINTFKCLLITVKP